ncbi:MAG: biopolymer transporter ExbB [Fibrobacteres bacterium]|nr:biopolymer transporter ExbB [Fibrobacterota bacterium]
MLARLFRKTRFTALLALLAASAWHCSDRVAGGATEAGNTVTASLEGSVLTSDGIAAVNARVSLLPADFDPGSGDTLPKPWEAFTDRMGEYHLETAKTGLYNILIESANQEGFALIQGISIDSLDLGKTIPMRTAALSDPGTVTVPVPAGSTGGHLYLPGTRTMVNLDTATPIAGQITLSGVPSGLFSRLLFARSGFPTVNLLERTIQVSPGTDLPLDPYHAWRFKRRITIHPAASGAPLSADLTHFPLLIRLDSGNFDFSQARSDGADLRLTKSDGRTPLPVEIEEWDAVGKKAAIWVGIDTVFAADTAQSLRLLTGRDSVAGISDPASVFDTAAGFVGAWHLGGNLRDASGFANNGVDSGSQSVPGLIGQARSFDGRNRHIGIADAPSLRFGAGDFALSAWFKADAVDSTRQIFAKRDSASNYEMQIDGGGNLSLLVNSYGRTDRFLVSKAHVQAGVWYHADLLMEGGKASFYLNGNLESGPLVFNEDARPASPLWFGGDPAVPGAENFKGSLEEIEFARSSRSGEWVRLTYATQKENAAIVEVGPAE